MSDFNVRSDSVNVEQIMDQIRARVREKRGVDYTEAQIRELAQVKLEKVLDPRGVRSELLEAFRQQRPPYEPPVVPTLVFEDTTLFETHRGPLRFMRRLLQPILKLFFNPNALIHALHTQAAINQANLEREKTRETKHRDVEALYFEVIHNLVFELTRLGIEAKNLRMRVESLSSRVEFNERRARALEGAVVYKPSSEDRFEAPPEPVAAPGPDRASATPPAVAPAEGPGQRSRRRRRRRGRRGGLPAAAVMGAGSASGAAGTGPNGDDSGAADAGDGDAPAGDSDPAPPPGDHEQ